MAPPSSGVVGAGGIASRSTPCRSRWRSRTAGGPADRVVPVTCMGTVASPMAWSGQRKKLACVVPGIGASRRARSCREARTAGVRRTRPPSRWPHAQPRAGCRRPRSKPGTAWAPSRSRSRGACPCIGTRSLTTSALPAVRRAPPLRRTARADRHSCWCRRLFRVDEVPHTRSPARSPVSTWNKLFVAPKRASRPVAFATSVAASAAVRAAIARSAIHRGRRYR